MTTTQTPLASLTLRPGGTITVQQIDDNTVALGYRDTDLWMALSIYVTPEQARVLAGELLDAAGTP